MNMWRGRTLRIIRRGFSPIEFRTRCCAIRWMQFMKALLWYFDGGSKHFLIEEERK